MKAKQLTFRGIKRTVITIIFLGFLCLSLKGVYCPGRDSLGRAWRYPLATGPEI